MPTQTPVVELHGPTTDHTTGPYGDEGCREAFHLTIDGTDVYVPYTGVKESAYDTYGLPVETFDVTRIGLYDGHIHAEADVEGGVIELIPEYNSATSRFEGYDSWTLEFFEDAEDVLDVVHTRE